MTAPAVRIALVVGLLLVAPVGNYPPAQLVFAMLLAVLLFASARWPIGVAAVAALFAAGVGMRLALFDAGNSDVLAVTTAAIDRVLAGGNPYGVGYDITRPPGGPFPYGPVALLWYLPFRSDPRILEFAVSLAILAALAVRGRPLGLAVFALLPQLVITASDGANDTSAGLLILLALLTAKRSPLWGAVLLAVAVAFKPYAAAWLPPLVAWSGSAAIVGFLGGFAVTWAPALLVWGPASVLTSLRLAEAIHTTSYYSLAQVVERLLGLRLPPELFDRLRFVAGGLIAAVTWFLVPRRDADDDEAAARRDGAGARADRGFHAVVIAGIAIYLGTLYSAYWSTYAYFAAIAPVVCWHLDEWLGLAEGRVRRGRIIGAIPRATRSPDR